MKRLFIIWLFMMGAFAAKAQTLQVFGPDSICLSSYATFDAVYTGSNLISYKWTFSQTPSAVTGNSDTSRNLTVTFADTGTVTATCTVTYGSNKSTVTAKKKMKILLCRSSTCLGTSSPTPFFTENFGSQQGTNNYWYLGQNGSSGTTTYAQGQPGNVQDGSYIVTVNPQIAKSNWANISDHTGNTNGGMMVINADLAPGIFYTRTVTGLCQGAQYTFNAWLLTVNLQNSLESGDAGGSYKWVNVTFLVYNALNNQLIDSVNTADVPMNLGNPNSWKQYGFTFKSPPNVDSVKVVMRNNGLGGSGNDLAIDDIQFTYCGPQLITTLKDSTATGDTVCAGNPLTLQATINPQNYFNNVQYQWQVSKDGTNWDSIPNSNNTLLNINTLPTDTTHAIYYRFIAADSGNIGVSTCISPSNTFSLMVLKSPNISPRDTTICFGDTATLSAQVGYTNYKWSTGDATSSISVNPTVTTSYKVSATLVTPKLGSCTDSATATVTVFNSALLNLGKDTSICQGDTIALNAAIPGATKYLWNTKDTTAIIRVSKSGTYSVIASYSNHCFAYDTITVTVNSLPIVSASAPASVCAGSGIQLTANNAATKFSWTGPNKFSSALQNPLITNPTISAGGVYTVIGTDINGCSNNASATVTVNPLPAVIDTVTNVSCYGNSNGAISLGVSGGSTPYNFKWSTSAITQNISGLTAGNYSDTITDAKGCKTTIAATVMQPVKLSVSATVDSVTCFGAKNGKVALNVTGGTGPYTYLWSNDSTSSSISHADTGHYSVIVTDAHGCTAFDTVTVSQPAKLSVTATVDSVSCFGAKDGKAALNVTGGTLPYSYLWNNSLTTSSISSLDTGRYSVIVTDAHGCTAFDTVTVSQPAKLSVTATADSVTCSGAKDGKVTLNVTGGTLSYSYLWNNGLKIPAISSLDTGRYSVIVTDAHGCTAFDTVVVFQPAKLSVTATVDSVSCFGAKNGTVALNVIGGTGPYTYLWSNGLKIPVISSLDTGHYSAIVTDAHGCTAFDTVAVFQPAKLSVTATADSVTCFGAKNGKVALNVTGGTLPFSYLWNNSLTTSSISSLDTGHYSVIVTDAHGCTAFDTIVVSQPAKLTTSYSITNVSCNGGNDGAVNLTIGGGTIPYTYLWNNGATKQNLSNLVAGTYSVIVKDANGCTAYDTAIVTQPAKLTASHFITNVSCNSGNTGAVLLTVTGGTTSYSYRWNNGAAVQNISGLTAGQYTVTITDGHGCTVFDTAVITQPAKLIASHSITNISCNGGNSGAVNLTIGGGTGLYTYNWSNGGTSQNLSNLIAGTYSVIVKDANGCTAYDTATVTQPAKLTTSHSITNVSCNGGNNGAINLTVNGGAGSYIYTWSNGSASQNLSNLVAGTYSVIVKDANGCTAYDTAVVTQPARLAISHAIANITCFGSNNGAITLNVTGGTGAYTFTWNNKAASQDISGLSAGKYSVIITDANGCKATDSAVIAQPPLLTAAASATPITCYGLSNGSIRITASGGTALYQYSLDGTSFQGSNTFNNLAPGSYIAIVRDANSCTTTTQVAITQPDSLAVSNSVINVSCYGGNNGAVSLKVTGGTTPYTFAWNNNAPAQNITGLTAGSYTASITDANGCNARDTAIISQPPLLAFSAGTIPVKCNGGNDGAIIISPSGGTAPYQYSLDGRNFQNNNKFNNLTANTYTVTVRDANGCSISAVEYLTTLAPPSIPTVTAGAVCGGGNITLKAAGAQGNEDYRWYGDSAAGTLLQTNGNIYTTYPLSQTATFYTTIYNTVTGCESPRLPVIAEVHPLPLVTATGGTACEGSTVQLRSSGGYSYRWTGPGFSSDEQNPAISQITPGAAGIYTIIATDANGCSNTATVPVAVDLPPVVQLGNDTLLAEGTRYVLDAGNPGATYQWNIGVATRQITADTAGTYRVNVSMGACTVSDSVRIRYFIPPVVNLVHDTTLCTGESLTLKATNPGATYKWNDGTTSDTLIVTRPGKYWVEAKKFTATVSDTIQVNYLSPAAINLGRDTVLCQGTPLTLDAGVPGLSYFWNTRERTQKIHIDAPGVYWVIASNGACLARDSIRVSYDPLPAVNLTADTTICRGESLTLNAYNPGAAYLWSTGDTTASVTVNTQNTFGVTVTRGACTVRDSLRLFLNPPPNISLRKDTVLCDGQSLLLDAGSSISTSYRWNDGSSDPVKIINAPGQYWVLATYGICLARDTITVSLRKPPAVQLGSNLSICAGEKVILRPNLKKALFTWNDNSSGDSLTVTQPGKYWLTAMDLQCGTLSSDTVNVAVKGPPAVSLGNDTTICKGEYITLIPKAVDITNYRWQDGSSGSSFRTNQEGIYTVTVANDCGNNSADIRVRTTDCSVTGDLYMPNAFTPNHDGNNDFFRPKYFVTITYFEMFVYNRWGQLICRTQNIDKGWDGTFNGQPCDLGTYVWYIRYKKQNDPKEHFKKGDVILVR